MSGLAPSVLIFWALEVAAEAFVCWLLFRKGHFRRIPLFTAYIVIDLCQAAFLFFIYARFGFRSHIAFLSAWISQGVVLVSEILGTVEVIHHMLSPYRGVWGLTKRLMWLACLIAMVYILFTIKESNTHIYSRFTPTLFVYIDRSFRLVFSLLLLALLFLGRHYLIPFSSIYQMILVGICFRACVAVLNMAFLQAFFLREFPHSMMVSNDIKLVSGLAVQSLWVWAIRSPAVVSRADAASFATQPQPQAQHFTRGAG